jgi:SAM-dependent methyltransferase
MPEEPRRIVESGYDAIAERYADAIRRGRGPQTFFRRFLGRVLELIPDGGRGLDLGSGAGLITAEVATRARVVAVDISAGQLELASGNAPSAAFVRADMTDVAFAPRSFDAVVAFWTLIHVRRELHAGIPDVSTAGSGPAASSPARSAAVTTPPKSRSASTGRRCIGATSTRTRSSPFPRRGIRTRAGGRDRGRG